MSGTGDLTFSPETPVTRSMIVSILHRLENSPSVVTASIFNDVTNDSWYYIPVTWAAQESIVTGFDDGTFRPNETLTREQLAAILYNYCISQDIDCTITTNLDLYEDVSNISPWAKEALCWANTNGLINGISDTKIDPQGQATRAQIAIIIQRFCEKYNF